MFPYFTFPYITGVYCVSTYFKHWCSYWDIHDSHNKWIILLLLNTHGHMCIQKEANACYTPEVTFDPTHNNLI